jgi:hypothetical protein
MIFSFISFGVLFQNFLFDWTNYSPDFLHQSVCFSKMTSVIYMAMALILYSNFVTWPIVLPGAGGLLITAGVYIGIIAIRNKFIF